MKEEILLILQENKVNKGRKDHKRQAQTVKYDEQNSEKN
jgi:hypothetical protein